MNELNFGTKIRQALNEGVRDGAGVSPQFAKRLRAARERALEARKPELAAQPALLLADNALGGLGGLGGFSLRVLLPLAVVMAGLFGIHTWQQEQRAADVEEIDARLLADDLPLDAYLDKGFEAWLKKRSER
ncbi:MAG: DUF3619 family protein [Betaproteobacteria bacterium]|nr:DUF3619 family protein [Betaproteobacteria bacterium]